MQTNIKKNEKEIKYSIYLAGIKQNKAIQLIDLISF